MRRVLAPVLLALTLSAAPLALAQSEERSSSSSSRRYRGLVKLAVFGVVVVGGGIYKLATGGNASAPAETDTAKREEGEGGASS